MVTGIWGKKIGMTQVFADDKVVPVTAIDVKNWFVTQIKTQERDGYNAVQIGRVKDRFSDAAFSADWLKKPKRYFTFVREVRLDGETLNIKVGQSADFHSILSLGDVVDAYGKTKGCGFAGVVRRHNFGGPPKSHGSTMGKRPGSIGSETACGHVDKGKKMPGHMGDRNRCTRNLEIVKIDNDTKMLLVKGAVPGKAGSLVFLRKA